MMITTHNMARKLHERFNDQNAILGTHTVILKEIVSTQKEVVSTLKEISSTQKEMSSTLKSIDNKIEQKL